MTKKFGQNFLINKKVAQREVSLAKICSDDVVLEVGPGKGVLTGLLAEKAKQVVCVEIDKSLVSVLRDSVPDNVLLINDDVLNIDFDDLPVFNKIVSNLPFQISSPVTFKFLDYTFDLAVLIYQKEFAERMAARAGDENYSRLSVNVYYRSICKIEGVVSKGCFYPQPRVDSCIVSLVPREQPAFSVKDEEFFFDFTKNLFNHRRKKIGSIIKLVYGIDALSLPYVDERVERLSAEMIGELSDELLKVL